MYMYHINKNSQFQYCYVDGLQEKAGLVTCTHVHVNSNNLSVMIKLYKCIAIELTPSLVRSTTLSVNLQCQVVRDLLCGFFIRTCPLVALSCPVPSHGPQGLWHHQCFLRILQIKTACSASSFIFFVMVFV